MSFDFDATYAAMLTQTISVIRISEATFTTDAEGNTAPSPAPPERQYPGLIQQQSTLNQTTETRPGPNILASDHLLFLGPDALLDGRDQVRDPDGRLYEVVGHPAILRTDRGIHHIEANLRLLTS